MQIQIDAVRQILGEGCTRLTLSNAVHFKSKRHPGGQVARRSPRRFELVRRLLLSRDR